MLQTSGATKVTTPIKNISAAKTRPSGQARARMKRGGENVRWKRLTAMLDQAMTEAAKLPPHRIDEAVRIMTANTKLTSAISRLVFFKHLTPLQGMAARRYADVMGKFERFCLPVSSRSIRAQDIDKPRAGEDQEIQRHILNGTIDEYEDEAKRAKRDYNKVRKVLDRYSDGDTGRNAAKSVLDDLCLSDQEPPAQYRENIAAVLSALAKEFGIKERR